MGVPVWHQEKQVRAMLGHYLNYTDVLLPFLINILGFNSWDSSLLNTLHIYNDHVSCLTPRTK